MFSWEAPGTCVCRFKPTPKPPQQCKNPESGMCGTDDDCGKDGFCIPHP